MTLALRIDALDMPNVRASEGAGTVTLVYGTDNMWQVFNGTVAKTCVLPTTGILKGQRVCIESQGAGTITVQSSGLNTLAFVDSLQSKLECIALQDAPTSAAHWKVHLDYSQRQYLHGTTYNGGNAPTLGSAAGGFSVTRAVFIPYQMQDGTWRLKGQLSINYSSTSANTTLTVNGITSKTAGGIQPVNVQFADGTQANVKYAYFGSPGTNTLDFRSVAAETSAFLWFDIEIDAKPTWAY